MPKRLTDRDRTKHEQTIRDRETLVHLGGRIRLLREERRFSQEKLAELAGITSKFVGEVERVETNPSTTSIARLAFALSVTVGDLFQAGDHLLPVPATQLALVKETYDSLGLAIEGLKTPPASGPNGGPNGGTNGGGSPRPPTAPPTPRHRVKPRTKR